MSLGLKETLERRFVTSVDVSSSCNKRWHGLSKITKTSQNKTETHFGHCFYWSTTEAINEVKIWCTPCQQAVSLACDILERLLSWWTFLTETKNTQDNKMNQVALEGNLFSLLRREPEIISRRRKEGRGWSAISLGKDATIAAIPVIRGLKRKPG